MKNVFISFESGNNLLIYTENLTTEECEKIINKATDEVIVDCYEIADNDIQFYCIDERIWIDTPEKENKLRAMINN